MVIIFKFSNVVLFLELNHHLINYFVNSDILIYSLLKSFEIIFLIIFHYLEIILIITMSLLDFHFYEQISILLLEL